MYITADDIVRQSFGHVLDMVERFQNAATEGDDASKKKKRKLVELKVSEVSKSVMTAIVQHCDSVGSGLLLFSLALLCLDRLSFRSSELG